MNSKERSEITMRSYLKLEKFHPERVAADKDLKIKREALLSLEKGDDEGAVIRAMEEYDYAIARAAKAESMFPTKREAKRERDRLYWSNRGWQK